MKGVAAKPRAPGPLAIRNVGWKAGSTAILTRINALLFPGELCALIGPSGAGKSSLIKVLLGLRKPSSGEVVLGAGRVDEAGPVGYVPQDDALHTALNVRDALHYAALLRLPDAVDTERNKRVDDVIRQVGLWDRKDLRIGKLSGGQRKRVSVALELLTSPGLLILDEPTSGLDPGMEAHMMGLFKDVAAGGRVVLVATHAMESLNLSQALLILVEGHVAYFGRPQEALTFFEVPTHAAIFAALKARRGSEWAVRFEQHPLKHQFQARVQGVAA